MEGIRGSMKTGTKVGAEWPEWTGWQQMAHFREKAGLTQQQVAERAGLHYTWVGKVERGQQTNPNLRAVLAYAKAVGIPPSALM